MEQKLRDHEAGEKCGLSGNESWLSKAADIIEEREESQVVESK